MITRDFVRTRTTTKETLISVVDALIGALAMGLVVILSTGILLIMA